MHPHRPASFISLVLSCFTAVCVTGGCASTAAERPGASTAATAALTRADLDAASADGERTLGTETTNSRAALVRAITRYERAMKQLNLDLRTAAIGGAMAGGLNQRYLDSALAHADRALTQVDHDLDVASRDPNISLDLCVACWEKDWNGNGRVDARDRLLFQIEQDAEGHPIPEGDPRRKPTFRFDVGDVSWARAFVAFQRAAINLVRAYDFSDVNRLLDERDRRPELLRLRLSHPERVKLARSLILDGLHHSDTSRRAYLKETDDEREWLPNPRQKSHALPLPVDNNLYDTWAEVVSDLERLVRGEEGLSVAELAQLGDHRWKAPPSGYIDVGRLLSEPRDLLIDLDGLERMEAKRSAETQLSNLLGPSYVKRMRPSPLLRRLGRMKGEVDRGEESLERKLRYLFWIN